MFEKAKKKEQIIKPKHNSKQKKAQNTLGKYNPITNPQLFSTSILQKNSFGSNEYGLQIVDRLIHLKPSHILSVFNDQMIMDYIDEFLRRLYKAKESTERIPKFANYYKNYLQFFCKPIFVNVELNEIIQSYGEAKAEVYYNNNYGNDQSKRQKTTNDKGKSIFSRTLKHEIDNNSSFGESSINYSIKQDEQDLNNINIMKIFNYEESLLSILETFTQKPPAITNYLINKIPQRSKKVKSLEKHLAITERVRINRDHFKGNNTKREIKATSRKQNIHTNQISSYKSFNQKEQSIHSRNKPIKLTNAKTFHMKTKTTINDLKPNITIQSQGKVPFEYLTSTKTLSSLRQSALSKYSNVNDVMKLTLHLYSPTAKGRNAQTNTIKHHHTLSSPTINSINININNHICLNEPKSPIQNDNKRNMTLKPKSKAIILRNKPQSLTKKKTKNIGCYLKLYSSFTIFDLQQQLLNSKSKFNNKKSIESKRNDDKLFVLRHQSPNKLKIATINYSQLANPLNNKQSISLTNRKSFKKSKRIISNK